MHLLVALVLTAAPASVTLTGFPFVKQKPDFCGEAVVEMALGRLGRHVTQDDVFNASGLDPLKGRGVWANELATSLRRLGVEPGKVWYRVDPKHAAAHVDAQWSALHADLVAGQPSIVCMHYDASPGTTEHFRLITGYDAERDEVIFQEPAVDEGADRRMRRDEFLALWTFKPAKDRWMVIRLRITPGLDVAPPTFTAPDPATLSQHVQARKEALPKGTTLVWEKPFLVIGDEPPDTVRSRAKDVVRWCRDLLLKDFFLEAPATLHEVWVLKDAPSYQRVSRELFQTSPETPYGYYLAHRRALVMNIRPGYGTLTHELVHPFMDHAWSRVPAWMNEGVASLFEFPYEHEGHLKGRINWRLPALQRGLSSKTVPSFEALTHLSDEAFYEDVDGVHYAAARYLCFWLQEKGLLTTFVRRALELQDEDATGFRALTEVLGAEPDTKRAEWETFVKALSRS